MRLDAPEALAAISMNGRTPPHVGRRPGGRGYIHWAAFDNFELALGYRKRCGLIAVDRTTQERHIKPSARRLGEIARVNAL